MTPKTTATSHCVMNEMVLPNDANSLGNLFGGRLMQWMDIAAAISAQRHANEVCITAAVDSVEFHSPIRVGEIVILESQVNRAFTTSMEVEINVWAEDPKARTKRKCNRAFFTFVAINEAGRPIPVPPLEPRTDEEQERFENAAKRREIRLVLAGRLKLEDAAHLREDLLTAIKIKRQDAGQTV